MKTNDNRFINSSIEDHQILIFESDSIKINMDAGLIVGSFQKEKKSKSLGIDIDFVSYKAIKFEVPKSYLIDNSGQKLLPHGTSHFRSDNHYKKDKEHGIGIVFVSTGKGSYINLPVRLYLPPFIFVDGSDALTLPEIGIN